MRRRRTRPSWIRFRGGAARSLRLPLAQPAWQLRQTSPDVVAEIDALLDHHTEGQIVTILNDRGFVSGEGKAFSSRMVQRLCRAYGFKTRYDRLRDADMMTLVEIAPLLGVSTQTVMIWRSHGLLRAHTYNDKNECLFEPLGDDVPVRYKWKGLTATLRRLQSDTDPTKEVQCEA